MKSCAAVGVGFHVLFGAWLVATSLAACGSEPASAPKTPDAAPPPRASAEPAAPSPDTATANAASPAAPADTKPEADAKPEADEKTAATPPKDPNAMREVKYVVTPEGLKIEVAGVRFVAAAQAIKIAQGWGAKITVKAEVLDGKEHVLLNPKHGPIAFAAAVFKPGSTEAERIPDERAGEGDMKLTPGKPSSFSREFPNKGGRVLGIGETLDMEVALWGLGDTTEDRRPVKQFFHVKMKVDKGKPKAIVEPPASAGK